MHITQSRKAAAAAAVTFALLAGGAGAVALGQSEAMAANAEEQEPTSAEVVSQINYYGDYEGNGTVDEWASAMGEKAANSESALQAVLIKMGGRADVDWNGSRASVVQIKSDISHAMSISDFKGIDKQIAKLDTTTDEAIAARDAEIEAERIAAEEAAAAAAAEAAAAAYYDYGYSSGGGYHPTGGLTPQSGVNYYGDQRETYYSSNVLYHYNTSNWALDDEGFYREGDYYVVAANSGQYSNGDVIETSKGEAIVRDSGCDYGTTDFYVAW